MRRSPPRSTRSVDVPPGCSTRCLGIRLRVGGRSGFAGARDRVGVAHHDRRGVARDRVAARAAVQRRDPEARRGDERAASSLIAFARPAAMSPPSGRRGRRHRHRSAAPAGSRGAANRTNVSAPPAQPTVSVASSSPSRLSRTLPPISAGSSSPRPPARPPRRRHQQLERTVRRAVLRQRHHRRDRDAVVGAERRPVGAQPLAVADDVDRPARGSIRAAGSRSHTMSRWPCRITAGARSRPGVAGTCDDEVAGAVAPRRIPCACRLRRRAQPPVLLGARARIAFERLEAAPEPRPEPANGSSAVIGATLAGVLGRRRSRSVATDASVGERPWSTSRT